MWEREQNRLWRASSGHALFLPTCRRLLPASPARLGTPGPGENLSFLLRCGPPARRGHCWPAAHTCSVAQSCPTLYDPMNCSTSGLPVHHQLLEFTQTHVHSVGDVIQPSHPLSSPSLHAFQYFPSSGSFQMSQLFAPGGQSTGVLATASALPMNTQD